MMLPCFFPYLWQLCHLTFFMYDRHMILPCFFPLRMAAVWSHLGSFLCMTPMWSYLGFFLCMAATYMLLPRFFPMCGSYLYALTWILSYVWQLQYIILPGFFPMYGSYLYALTWVLSYVWQQCDPWYDPYSWQSHHSLVLGRCIWHYYALPTNHTANLILRRFSLFCIWFVILKNLQ